MEKKHIVIPFNMEMKQEGEGEFYEFEGYGSTFSDIDYGYDEVKAGAFTESIVELKLAGKKLPVLWQHRGGEPVGVYAELREDAKGLFVKGQLPKTDTFVSGRVYPQMKIGSVTGLSIGYICTEYSYKDVDGMRVRIIEKAQLMEISLVTFPMNDKAGITDVKSIEAGDLTGITPRELDLLLRKRLNMSRTVAKKFVACLDFDKLRDADDSNQRDAEQKAFADLQQEIIDELNQIGG